MHASRRFRRATASASISSSASATARARSRGPPSTSSSARSWVAIGVEQEPVAVELPELWLLGHVVDRGVVDSDPPVDVFVPREPAVASILADSSATRDPVPVEQPLVLVAEAAPCAGEANRPGTEPRRSDQVRSVNTVVSIVRNQFTGSFLLIHQGTDHIVGYEDNSPVRVGSWIRGIIKSEENIRAFRHEMNPTL